MHVLLFCVLLAQAGTGMPPQPDFSGHWTLVVALPSGVSVPTTLDVRQTVTRTNIRGEPMTPFYRTIEIERQFDTGASTDTHLIGIVGGVGGGGVNGAGRATQIPPRVNSQHAVTWDGNTLVFELATYTGYGPGTGDWTARRETWALQLNGELVVTITTNGSGEHERTVSAAFRRRE